MSRKKIAINDLDDFENEDISNAIDDLEYPEFDFFIPKYKMRTQTDASGNESEIKKIESVNIDYAKMRRRLESWGFFSQTIDKTRFFFRMVDNIIEEVTDEQIRDFLDKKIRNMPDVIDFGIKKEMVENKFLGGNENLLRKTIINRLRPNKEIIYLEDTVDKAYFFYQNCIVEVSQFGIKQIDYKDNDKVVFKGSILKRDYVPMQKEEFEKGIYYQLLQNIADGAIINKHTGTREHQRLEDFKTVVGYLLHKFFKRKLKCIWLLDSRGDAKSPKGRSGKGLILKGCMHMLNSDEQLDKVYVEIDGKELDQSKATKFEEAAINTKLIHLNDIEAYFKVTGIFNAIVEGFKIRQMYKAPFLIKCKCAVSSNFVPKTDTDSVRDRFLEVQTTAYYTANYSPQDEFKKWFFSDEFTKEDWICFDNTQLHCVQQYLLNGLKKPTDINLESRKLQESTNTDFIDFMEWYEVEKMHGNEHIVFKEELKTEFLKMFPDHAKNLTTNKLTYWVQNYTKYRKDDKGNHVFEPYNDENKSRYDKVLKDGPLGAKRAYIFYRNKNETKQ